MAEERSLPGWPQNKLVKEVRQPGHGPRPSQDRTGTRTGRWRPRPQLPVFMLYQNFHTQRFDKAKQHVSLSELFEQNVLIKRRDTSH